MNRTELDFYTKLKAWGNALAESDRIDKLARSGPDGWNQKISDTAPNLDKLRGPMYTALNRFAIQYSKREDL